MKLDSSPLVSTEWLANHLNDPGLRIVDVRWRSRYENGLGISFDDPEGYQSGHIPGAVFAGMISDLSDPNHHVPDMLAPPEQFAAAMGRIGVGNDTLVVAYDNMGLPLGSARLWWALSYYGHDRVRVLDGGLREWQSEGRPLSTVPIPPAPSQFTVKPRPQWLATKADVVAALGQTTTILVDCLNAELYRGGGDRHLWGQRAGHIPGAVNVPYLANIDAALATATAAEREQILASGRSFKFSRPDALAALYRTAGVVPEKEVITYCGRGYAAPAACWRSSSWATRESVCTMARGRNGALIYRFRSSTAFRQPFASGIAMTPNPAVNIAPSGRSDLARKGVRGRSPLRWASCNALIAA